MFERVTVGLAVLAVAAVPSGAQAAGIDSDSQAERALADDRPKTEPIVRAWSSPPPTDQESEDDTAALTEAELRRLFPDLQVKTSSSTPFKVLLGAFVPFQLIAIGVGTDVHVGERLRLSALVSLGTTIAHPYRREWETNVYAEVGLGMAALRWSSGTTSIWPVPKLEGKAPSGRELRVVLPSTHSFELEGGVMSGHAVLFRCTANCAPEPSSDSTYVKAALQVAMPYAGIRYAYFRKASSASAHISVTQQFQLATHLIFRPFEQPSPDLWNFGVERVRRRDLGFRVLTRLPLFGCSASGRCVSIDLGAGLLPSPTELFLSWALRVLWAET